jgi:hypothetical protein
VCWVGIRKFQLACIREFRITVNLHVIVVIMDAVLISLCILTMSFVFVVNPWSSIILGVSHPSPWLWVSGMLVTAVQGGMFRALRYVWRVGHMYGVVSSCGRPRFWRPVGRGGAKPMPTQTAKVMVFICPGWVMVIVLSWVCSSCVMTSPALGSRLYASRSPHLSLRGTSRAFCEVRKMSSDQKRAEKGGIWSVLESVGDHRVAMMSGVTDVDVLMSPAWRVEAMMEGRESMDAMCPTARVTRRSLLFWVMCGLSWRWVGSSGPLY